MMVFNYGDIGDFKGNSKDVDINVLKALDPKTLLLGVGFIAVGTLIICVGSFKHGLMFIYRLRVTYCTI